MDQKILKPVLLNAEQLNKVFALKTNGSNVNFITGKGDIPFVEIHNQFASALISLQGAHLLSWIPDLGTFRDADCDLRCGDHRLLIFISQCPLQKRVLHNLAPIQFYIPIPKDLF